MGGENREIEEKWQRDIHIFIQACELSHKPADRERTQDMNNTVVSGSSRVVFSVNFYQGEFAKLALVRQLKTIRWDF